MNKKSLSNTKNRSYAADYSPKEKLDVDDLIDSIRDKILQTLEEKASQYEPQQRD